MTTLDPQSVHVGDMLTIDRRYDRRLGAASLRVNRIVVPWFGQSGIGFEVVINGDRQVLDAAWFTGRAV